MQSIIPKVDYINLIDLEKLTITKTIKLANKPLGVIICILKKAVPI